MMALGLLTVAPGCVAEYDEPDVVYVAGGCAAVPVGDGVVVEGPCNYYRVVYVDGIPYRYYYGWEGGAWVSLGWAGWYGGGWHYGPGWRGGVIRGGWHGGVRVGGEWHGGGGYHGGYHGGGHGGHR